MVDVNTDITYSNVRCVARFFPFKVRETPAVTDDNNSFIEADEFIEDDAIVSCSVIRDKNSPSDQFTLVLKPKMDYYNMVKPGDWVLIYLDQVGDIDLKNRKGLKCIGNVDRIARNTIALNDGSVVTTFTIHGSGWGKILQVSEMYYNPYLLSLLMQALSPAPVALGFQLNGSPLDFINGYIDIFLGDAREQGLKNTLFPELIPPQLYIALGGEERAKGSNVSFHDVLVKEFNDNANEGYSVARDVSRVLSDNLWNTLKQAANEVINELFTDTRDGKPVLVFRKQLLTPQLRRDLINGGVTDISEKHIVNTNLGASDHELVNYISLFSTNSLITDIAWYAQGEFKDKLPIILGDSTKRFGLRRFERNTEYGFTKDSNVGFDLILKWAQELAEYWFNCYHFESGTIELRGPTDFQIGNFVRLTDKSAVYLVEGITWEWQFGEPITTSLTVSTGIREDGGFLDQDTSTGYSRGTTYYGRTADKTFAEVSLPSNVVTQPTQPMQPLTPSAPKISNTTDNSRRWDLGLFSGPGKYSGGRGGS